MKTLANFIKRQDNFGAPVFMRYKSETEYKTTFGGAVSLVTFIIITLFSIDVFLQMLARIDPKVVRQTVYHETELLASEVKIAKDMYFEIGIFIASNEN